MRATVKSLASLGTDGSISGRPFLLRAERDAVLTGIDGSLATTFGWTKPPAVRPLTITQVPTWASHSRDQVHNGLDRGAAVHAAGCRDSGVSPELLARPLPGDRVDRVQLEAGDCAQGDVRTSDVRIASRVVHVQKMTREMLFRRFELRAAIGAQDEKLTRTIEAVPVSEILSRPPDQLAEELFEELRIEPPVLRESDTQASQEEAKVDVSHDPRRFILDRSRPFYVSGTRVSFHVEHPMQGGASNGVIGRATLGW